MVSTLDEHRGIKMRDLGVDGRRKQEFESSHI
jgi:hypothetical protein